jgi:hypothetical protein
MKFVRSNSQGLYLFRQQDLIILRHFPELLSIYLLKKHLVGEEEIIIRDTYRKGSCVHGSSSNWNCHK